MELERFKTEKKTCLLTVFIYLQFSYQLIHPFTNIWIYQQQTKETTTKKVSTRGDQKVRGKKISR